MSSVASPKKDGEALAALSRVWESVTIVHVLCQVAESHSFEHLQATHGLEEVAIHLSQFLLGLLSARVDRYGMLVIIGALFVLLMLGTQLGVDLNVLGWLISGPVDAAIRIILHIAGVA